MPSTTNTEHALATRFYAKYLTVMIVLSTALAIGVAQLLFGQLLGEGTPTFWVHVRDVIVLGGSTWTSALGVWGMTSILGNLTLLGSHFLCRNFVSQANRELAARAAGRAPFAIWALVAGYAALDIVLFPLTATGGHLERMALFFPLFMVVVGVASFVNAVAIDSWERSVVIKEIYTETD